MSAGDGNGWVVLPDGSQRWGLNGASGLLLHSVDAAGSDHVLLQHRAWWSHQGGTWGLPGGALDSGESAVQAALREFSEEVAGDLGNVVFSGIHRQEHTVWRYDTVLARSPQTSGLRVFTPGNDESAAIRWVALDQVPQMRLLPAFAGIWPLLHAALMQRVLLIVDAQAVLSDGADSADAVVRLRDDLAALGTAGISSTALPEGLPLTDLHLWFPRSVLVVADHSRSVPSVPGVEVVPASGTSSAAVADLALHHGDAPSVLAVGPDPGLLERHAPPEVRAVPASWLLKLTDRVEDDR